MDRLVKIIMGAVGVLCLGVGYVESTQGGGLMPLLAGAVLTFGALGLGGVASEAEEG